MSLQQLELLLEVKTNERTTRSMSVDEIYVLADAFLIQQLAEDDRLEKKTAAVNPKELAKYFSMWSNTSDGGLIIVGVADDGTIEGCLKESTQQINSLLDAARIYCPDAQFDHKRVRVSTERSYDDFVLVFRVQWRCDKVVKTHSGEAFVRSGSSKRLLTPDAVREMQITKGEVHFELENIGLRFPDDFDDVLVQEFVENVHVAKNLEYHHTEEDILVQARLGKMVGPNFVPNNACCLLLAKDPIPHFPGCKIRFLRYEGTEELTGENYNVIKDVTIEGSIPRLIQKAEQLLLSQIREYSALGKDGRFYGAAEYPKFAWYEAIVNACGHRSYNLKSMTVFVKMFDDKLVIMSPGFLPPTVTPQNIFHMHSPRNPFLMDALRYFGFVKCANEGTKRMRDEMLKHKLPEPKFVENKDGGGNLYVTLYNNSAQRSRSVPRDAARSLVPSEVYNDLSEDDKTIIRFLAEHEKITVSQASRITERDWGTAKKRLLQLVEKDVLIHRRRKDAKHDPSAHFILKR